MTYNEAVEIGDMHLLPLISKLYELDGYSIKLVKAHDGGRNVVYTCEKEGTDAIIIRIAYLSDRSREDILAEVEYIRFLYEHGGSVANVISSQNGNFLEIIVHDNQDYFICAFQKAVGKSLAENGYKYRKGVPLAEYFYNCGKVLGKLHQLSKKYVPIHCRYHFFDKYNGKYIDELIPDSLSLLKKKLAELLKTLTELDKNHESFGMVHFDYSDGNYMIDFDNGQITVFDFDNSCFCWYMYDLASVWTHGVGWIQFEPDTEKRRAFMEDYFTTVLAGYRSETEIEKSMLKNLPLFINVTVMESIIDAFEVMRNNDEEPECDEALSYLIKCMEEDIPYKGFFHEIYSCKEPFQYETRTV